MRLTNEIADCIAWFAAEGPGVPLGEDLNDIVKVGDRNSHEGGACVQYGSVSSSREDRLFVD